jgi:hypothetical protein
MIKDLEPFLVGMAVGIRYRPNFSLEDALGRIVDDILYSKESFFNSSVFPKVRHGVNEKVLLNEDTDDSLRINNSDTILEIQFGGTFSQGDLDKIVQAFDRQVVTGVLKDFKVREIGRVGLIKRYVITMEDLARTFVDKTIGRTLEGVNDINLRFSKKLPVSEALVKQGVNDHNNVIFNIIKKSDREEIFISVDFQRYYSPLLSTAADIKFSGFVGEARSFTSRKCVPWLNENYVEEVKA